jgi:RNA-directed DNA polymerase
MLANIYLHYALDVWFEETVKAHCRGAGYLCRYADDFVCAFEYASDAERFYRALGKRMDSFGLELAEEKTNLLKFSRLDRKHSGALEFLGFEFRWGLNRWRKPALKRRTARNRYRASLARLHAWMRANCRMRKEKFFAALNAKLRGYYNHCGVRGNFDSIDGFYYQVTRMLYRLMNRRSQRRSYNWKGFAELIKVFKLQRPRICHSF